jgi:hypothetical protein
MPNPEYALEPRVASLEAELRQVVKAVGDLTTGFDRVEAQIQNLSILIERVSAPKAANWLALIATGTSVTLLFITIGALVLLPMTKEITHLQAWNGRHGDLELHPVGKTRIDALEKSVLERAAINANGIRELDVKLQKEYQLMDASVRERVGAVEREVRERWVVDSAGLQTIADKTEKALSRITVLETKLEAKVKELKP